jgi:hypothetical protein
MLTCVNESLAPLSWQQGAAEISVTPGIEMRYPNPVAAHVIKSIPMANVTLDADQHLILANDLWKPYAN